MKRDMHHGAVSPAGFDDVTANAARLTVIVEDPDSGLPADAIATLKVLVGALTHLETEIGKLDAEIARRARENEVARRLMNVPGIGECPTFCVSVIWSMLPARNKDDADFERTAGRVAEGLQAA